MKRRSDDDDDNNESEHVYFDKLPIRPPFDDISTTKLDNSFRSSCFKNAVCTITTNLKININHFTNIIGGQLTSTLPGNRMVLVINGQRYSVIFYETGRFVLTNLFFFNRLKDIYDFFINFCLMLIKRGIATLKPVDDAREGPERVFKILFLIENCLFSFRFKDEVSSMSRFIFKVENNIYFIFKKKRYSNEGIDAQQTRVVML